MKVKLFTRDGEFVRDGVIPPFKIPPEVIVWGSRMFVKELTTEAEPDGSITQKYTEGMAYWLDAAGAVLGRTEGT